MTKLGFSREPAAWVGVITSLALVAADLGLHLSTDTIGHVAAAVPLVMALVVRSQVTPAKRPLAEIVTAKADAAHKVIADATDALAALTAVATAAGLVTPVAAVPLTVVPPPAPSPPDAA